MRLTTQQSQYFLSENEKFFTQVSHSKKRDPFLLKLYFSFIFQWIIFVVIMVLSIITVRSSFNNFKSDFDIMWINSDKSI